MEIKVGDIVTVKKEARIIEPHWNGGHDEKWEYSNLRGSVIAIYEQNVTTGGVNNGVKYTNHRVRFEDGNFWHYHKSSLTKPMIMDDGTELEVWL